VPKAALIHFFVTKKIKDKEKEDTNALPNSDPVLVLTRVNETREQVRKPLPFCYSSKHIKMEMIKSRLTSILVLLVRVQSSASEFEAS